MVESSQGKKYVEKAIKLKEKISIKGNLIALGYWKYKDRNRVYTDSSLPRPEEFQDESWDEEEKIFIIQYLNEGFTVRSGGCSSCRFDCGLRRNGSRCLSDGKYVYPEGLSHYLVEHNVRLPKEFVEHAKKPKPMNEKYILDIPNYDGSYNEPSYSWWENIKLEEG